MTTQNPSTELTRRLEQIPQGLITKALIDGLTSTVTTRAGTCEPDFRTRLQAAELILNRVLGRPVERQQIMTTQVETGPNMLELARTNPYVRDALRNQLDELETLAAQDAAAAAGRVIEG